VTDTVRLATEADLGPIAASLTKAFADDPVMNFLVGKPELPYDKGVKFFTLMCKIQLPHQHVYVTDGCEAVAIWAPPDKWKVPSAEIIKATPAFLSVFGVKKFVSALGASPLEKNHPKEPHYYLEVPRHRSRPPTQGSRRRGARARARAMRHGGCRRALRVVEGRERPVLPPLRVRSAPRGHAQEQRAHAVAHVARPQGGANAW
jgi:hypothetical protein